MRPRKQNRHLPKCVYERRGAYYLVTRGKWEPLGRDLAAALAEYARRHQATPEGSLDGLIDAALDVIYSKVTDSTKTAYESAAKTIKRLLRQFTSPGQIKGKDVAKAKILLADKPIMANRILSVMRQIFAYWVEQQMIDSNPAIGIKRYAEGKRTRLVSSEEFDAIHEQADARLRVILELWRLTGQRVMDVLRIRRADLRDEGIYFKQRKTGAELIVRWNPDLRATVERAKALHGNVRALTLIHNRRGVVPGYTAIHRQWTSACVAAGVSDVQMRDLRAMSITATRRQGKNATALAGHASEAMTRRYLRDREIPIVDGPSIGCPLDDDKIAIDSKG